MPPVKVGEYEVLKARDYKKDTIKDLKTGEVVPTGLPSSTASLSLACVPIRHP